MHLLPRHLKSSNVRQPTRRADFAGFLLRNLMFATRQQFWLPPEMSNVRNLHQVRVGVFLVHELNTNKMHRAASGAFSNEPPSVNYQMAPPFAAAKKTASCRVLRPAGAYTVFAYSNILGGSARTLDPCMPV